jgi:hypothetical protein
MEDILRLEDLHPGTVFRTLTQMPVRAVTTQWRDALAVLCVTLNQDPGALERMLRKTPVKTLVILNHWRGGVPEPEGCDD